MTTGSAHADIFFITTTAAPDAVSFAVSGTAVYGDHITVRIGSTSGLHEIAVHETGSGTPLGAYTVTPSVPATTAVVPLSPVPHSTSLTITITALGSTPGALDTITFYLPRDTTVPTNIASNVCTSGGYRYGYNGQMKDNEWAGEGNHYDYGFRRYDPRIGRPISMDPLFKKFPNLSPYQFFSNTPIWATDLDGLEAFFSTNGTFIRWGNDKTEKAPVFAVNSDNIQIGIGLNVKEFLDRSMWVYGDGGANLVVNSVDPAEYFAYAIQNLKNKNNYSEESLKLRHWKDAKNSYSDGTIQTSGKGNSLYNIFNKARNKFMQGDAQAFDKTDGATRNFAAVIKSQMNPESDPTKGGDQWVGGSGNGDNNDTWNNRVSNRIPTVKISLETRWFKGFTVFYRHGKNEKYKKENIKK